MTTLRIDLDGVVVGDISDRAKRALRFKKVGSRVYISALNGAELYIKTKSGVRESTMAEWFDFHKKKGTKHEPSQKSKQ